MSLSGLHHRAARRRPESRRRPWRRFAQCTNKADPRGPALGRPPSRDAARAHPVATGRLRRPYGTGEHRPGTVVRRESFVQGNVARASVRRLGSSVGHEQATRHHGEAEEPNPAEGRNCPGFARCWHTPEHNQRPGGEASERRGSEPQFRREGRATTPSIRSNVKRRTCQELMCVSSASACSTQYAVSILRYIAVAVERYSRACSQSPVRR